MDFIKQRNLNLKSKHLYNLYRLWQINFSVMYVHVLSFKNICSLTYFQIKTFVPVDEAERISQAFL